MALTTGARLGIYTVLEKLGEGGMGEVWRARDTKLGRDVALKTLPAALASDPGRLARLEREARLLASLNHPRIAAIYGLEDVAAPAPAGRERVRVLVLELVEGDTLAGRLARGRLAMADALDLARQIAEALEAAHEKGVVHRDLKPTNIKITPGGEVKVLDFGLAKLAGPAHSRSEDGAGAEADPGARPTMTALDATTPGVVLGTPAYMSPEQARGLAADRRTDVWAFGCVLYELLTGRSAFGRDTTAGTLAAVLEREPDWSRLPAGVPADVARVLRRCLAKDPGQRLRDIGDVRLLLDDAGRAGEGAVDVPRPRRARTPAVAAVLAAAALAALAATVWRQPAPGEPRRVSIAAPGPISAQLSGAISPDGRHLAFVATGPSGRSMLWVRSLDSLEARELPRTDRAAHPFWSPDSRSLGFVADGQLKRVDLDGGPVQTLADAALRNGAAWSPEGVILFSPRRGQLAVVPAAGGAATVVLPADGAGGSVFSWPDFLPDGRRFLYYGQHEDPGRNGVYAASIDGIDPVPVLTSDIQAKYAPPGYLLFVRDETLMAQPFDAGRLALHGQPAPVADGVWFARGANHASFSASHTGTLAYVNASLWNRQLAWIDRSGRPAGFVGRPDRYANITPQLSPDRATIAVGRGEFGSGDVWTLDAARGTPSRLTFGGYAGVPVWSGDGRRVLIQTGARVAVRDLETGGEETLIESAEGRVADWSDDGRFVVLAPNGSDLWAVDLAGDRRPFPYLETPAIEAQAQLAPDGAWIAYTSNETGRDEVYVQSFPVPGRKRQVSTAGGAMPRWRADGRELFYLAADQVMTAAPVGLDASFAAPPQPLFRTRLIVQGSESTGLSTAYDVTVDGQRFLLNGPPEDPGPPMTVVFDWPGALPR